MDHQCSALSALSSSDVLQMWYTWRYSRLHYEKSGQRAKNGVLEVPSLQNAELITTTWFAKQSIFSSLPVIAFATFGRFFLPHWRNCFTVPVAPTLTGKTQGLLTVEYLYSLAVMSFPMPVEGYRLVFSNSHIRTLIHLWYALQHKINCHILKHLKFLAVVFQFRAEFIFHWPTFAIHSTRCVDFVLFLF